MTIRSASLERISGKRVSPHHIAGVVVNPTNDEFLRQADICRKTAANALTPELRSGWLRLAAEWQSMVTSEGLALGGDATDLERGDGSPTGTAANRPSGPTL